MQAWILSEGRVETTTEHSAVARAHGQRERVWIHLTQRTPESDRLLSESFGIHPLVAEDVWLDRSAPKIEEFDGYLYIVIHGVRAASKPTELELYVLDVVFGPTWVITQHSKSAPAAWAQDLQELPPLLERGPAWLVHALLDRLIDRYLPFMDELSRQADELEVNVLTKAGLSEDEGLLQAIHALKRTLQTLCRITSHQRDLLSRLALGSYASIPPEVVPYFRDVRDHFARVADQVETYREVVTGSMESFLSLQSNRMNAAMKTLATISTIMLPVTCIASIYGMNFRYMPELYWRYGYPFALCLMLGVGTSLFLLLKRLRWL